MLGARGPRGTAHWIGYERERSGAAEARWAHNPKVGGSKPPSATFLVVGGRLEAGGVGDLGAGERTSVALAEWLRRSPAK